jgi:hypothetical protein
MMDTLDGQVLRLEYQDFSWRVPLFQTEVARMIEDKTFKFMVLARCIP